MKGVPKVNGIIEQVDSAALLWKKPGRCAEPYDDFCVEVAVTPDGNAAMRDSKDPDGGLLLFSRQGWGAFLADVRAGAFDLPA